MWKMCVIEIQAVEYVSHIWEVVKSICFAVEIVAEYLSGWTKYGFYGPEIIKSISKSSFVSSVILGQVNV